MAQRDLIALARQRIDEPRTHYEGCERDHRECLIQRMADAMGELRGELHMRLVAAREADERHEEELASLLAENERLRTELDDTTVLDSYAVENQRLSDERDRLREELARAMRLVLKVSAAVADYECQGNFNAAMAQEKRDE